ncbi:arabinan endo-1,5-alpha-L-arabinosidase [Novosphingobium sp. 1949]|uniref:Extracellular exo-alpha-(1->5)-L-arabinofuranosidase n=1 Tax=Novosphingobium organovorum TaxID=2930092 RepID=A0ABT0BCK0_9SPHN|nr:arabinan endo-1,5-alpha-L-arabinosidase [Novosphingobium organovorum]MCJ2182788.1 arabinan endo-1,5-alpha-L-arabinosidase [Novosphingobium organovorum]
MARRLCALSCLAGLALVAVGGSVHAGTQSPDPLSLNDKLTGALVPAHDPVLIREGDTWYVYNTIGKYIGVKTSKDLIHWEQASPLFSQLPAWTQKAVPGTEGIWAPDISYVNGEYRLYYSVSTFGSNRSAIGLATSPTLDPKAKGYHWTDHGLVVQSMPGDDFNAIDPNFVVDAQGRQWLALGSFWSGIKLFPLDPKTGKPWPGAEPYAIAQRPVPAGAPDPIEAPFILQHDGWYFLLASFDYCCKGVNSTYYTVMGRSRTITGPYLGKDGSSMMQGGGTILLRADLEEKHRFRGPGHVGAYTDAKGATTLVYHAYDREANGAPTLRLAPLTWDADGWPVPHT